MAESKATTSAAAKTASKAAAGKPVTKVASRATAKPAVKTDRATKTATAKTVETKPAAAKKTTAGKTTAVRSRAQKVAAVTPEQRYMMIAEAAYFRAEKRGFSGHHAWHDWYEAEREIDRMLAAGR